MKGNERERQKASSIEMEKMLKFYIEVKANPKIMTLAYTHEQRESEREMCTHHSHLYYVSMLMIQHWLFFMTYSTFSMNRTKQQQQEK